MKRACVIGAGPSGIAAAKALLADGIEVVVFEKSHEVGGNWVFRDGPGHSSVYETTHIISSKTFSQYEDFPMPASYPDYPSHVELREYFQAYAGHFGVVPIIRFGTEVLHAAQDGDRRWRLKIRREGVESEDVFDALLVANGHHWNPFIPTVPGQFTGQILHSHAFKRAEPFRDQRVLVVGAGNSACDVAVETSRVSKKTLISMRRGQHILPKFMFGVPNDLLYAKLLWLPRRLRQPLLRLGERLSQGDYEQYGLPEPEAGILEMHPTLNSELLYYIRHGRIGVRRGIERFSGSTVYFTDGAADELDAVVFATGYKITFPFFDPSFIDWSDALDIPLYRKMIHPQIDNLFFIGLFQPLGCIWPLADYQGRIAARAINGTWKRPADLAARIEHELSHPHYAFKKERRHSVEVDYHAFRKELLAELGA